MNVAWRLEVDIPSGPTISQAGAVEAQAFDRVAAINVEIIVGRDVV